MADPVATLREALADRYAFERELGRPEQAAGDRGLDARTDVYALGAVL